MGKWVVEKVGRVPKSAIKISPEEFIRETGVVPTPLDNVRCFKTKKCYYASGYRPGETILTILRFRKKGDC